MTDSFNFGDAFTGFVRAPTVSRGFLWKYWLSYVAVFFLVIFVLTGVFWPVMRYPWGLMLGIDDMYRGEPSELAVLSLFLFGVIPSVVIFWAMFEAAIQRRLVRAEGFKLRLFGKDELRLIAVGLFWAAFLIAHLFYVGAVVAPVSSEYAYQWGGYRNEFYFSLLIWLVLSVPWIFVAVKLAPAAALTTRDRKVRLAAAWRATKGRFWALFWAAALWLLGAFILYFIVFFGLATLLDRFLWNGMSRYADGQALNPFLMDYAILISWALFTFAFAGLLGLMHYLFSGPAALAARVADGAAGISDDQISAFE